MHKFMTASLNFIIFLGSTQPKTFCSLVTFYYLNIFTKKEKTTFLYIKNPPEEARNNEKVVIQRTYNKTKGRKGSKVTAHAFLKDTRMRNYPLLLVPVTITGKNTHTRTYAR